jgi:hypothetical protein
MNDFYILIVFKFNIVKEYLIIFHYNFTKHAHVAGIV